MPLIVPGVTSTSASGSASTNQTEEWQNKLVGKRLSEDEASNETTFSKRELPKETRIIEPGTIVTKDFKEDRLNVHVDQEGIVSHVVHG